MKYEMIFGNEALFDGAPDGATHATKSGGFYSIHDGMVKYVSDGIFNGMKISSVSGYLIAERRIIAEPKRWTWEDKKAGRLPEVGCNVSSAAYGYVCSVVAIDSNSRHVWCQFPDQSVGSCMIFEINPIETPSEKAQREEDEFVGSLAGTDINYGTGTVKELFEQGARAAYRKLKGGE